MLDGNSPYITDESKMKGSAEFLIMPENESEVIEAVRDAYLNGKCITTSSMRTGVCGGCVPQGGDVLSMEKMNKIIGIGEDDRGFYIRVQPAVTVRDLNKMLRSRRVSGLNDLTEGALDRFSGEPSGFFYPVDPTELNSSIGGNISTNASGPRTFKYGPTRNWIRRIKVVLSDGTLLDVKRGDIRADGRSFTLKMSDGDRIIPLPSYDFNMNVKNATGIMAADGMDLVDLFVGSEGIFGVVVEADVYVAPDHPLMSNIMFFPGPAEAYSFVRSLRDTQVVPEFLEFFDSGSLDLIRESRRRDPRFTEMPDIPDGAGSAVFFDIPYDGDILENYSIISKVAEKYRGSPENSWCGHEIRDRERFFAFRHSVPQTIFDHVASLKGTVPGIHKMGTDMSVPLEHLDEMTDLYYSVLNEAELDFVIFGHIGNGHVHVEIILEDLDDLERARKAYRKLAEYAISFGGSPSAEHGIGKLKKEYIEMMYGKKGLEEIKRTKSALDPKWILCRGNMVEP